MANGFKIGSGESDLFDLVEAYGNIDETHKNLPLNRNLGPASTTGPYFKLYNSSSAGFFGPRDPVSGALDKSNVWYVRKGSGVLGGLWGNIAPSIDIPMYFQGSKIQFAAKYSAPLWNRLDSTKLAQSIGMNISAHVGVTDESVTEVVLEKSNPLWVTVKTSNERQFPSRSYDLTTRGPLLLELCSGGGGGGAGKSGGVFGSRKGGGGGGGGGGYVSLCLDMNLCGKITIKMYSGGGRGVFDGWDEGRGRSGGRVEVLSGSNKVLEIEGGSRGGSSGDGGGSGSGGSPSILSTGLIPGFSGIYLIQSTSGGNGGEGTYANIGGGGRPFGGDGENAGSLELSGGGISSTISCSVRGKGHPGDRIVTESNGGGAGGGGGCLLGSYGGPYGAGGVGGLGYFNPKPADGWDGYPAGCLIYSAS